MRQYFSTFILIGGFLPKHPKTSIRRCQDHTFFTSFKCGFLIALLASVFIYTAYFDISHPFLNTLSGLFSLYLLLGSSTKVWFWSGFFIALLWFWWIGLSFIHYRMIWAIPIVELAIASIYGGIFWMIAKIALSIEHLAFKNRTELLSDSYSLLPLVLQAFGLLILSYIHPFGFDWLKPELMFVESYLGIEKWQFAIILIALVLVRWKRNILFLLLLTVTIQTISGSPVEPDRSIALVTLHIPVEEKWDPKRHAIHFQTVFEHIDHAIEHNKSTVVLPESVFPLYLNRSPELLQKLQKRAKRINIVTGGLYWDGKTPRNATYVFSSNGKITVINKVILVPFGEANPLPDFLSKWVNRLFYDNAIDYKASGKIIDYTLNGTLYRNAICFEATSERLYEGCPEQMIVLSNNGWFIPSIEPVLQRLLLQYYSKKYGTTIYHSINMSPSYIIRQGEVLQP